MPAPADARIATSAAYAEGEWVVVGGHGQRLPEKLEDIPTGVLVAKDNPAIAVLQRLKEDKPLL